MKVWKVVPCLDMIEFISPIFFLQLCYLRGHNEKKRKILLGLCHSGLSSLCLYPCKKISVLTYLNFYYSVHFPFVEKISLFVHYLFQKQPSRGVLRKRCSEKLLCNFFEITLRQECSPVNLLHIFRTPFPRNTSGWLLLLFYLFMLILTYLYFIIASYYFVIYLFVCFFIYFFVHLIVNNISSRYT